MRKFITLVETEIEIDDEMETPQEQETWDREQAIQKAVKLYCERELGWDMDRSYSVMFTASENELVIGPNEYEASLETIMKLRIFGEVSVSSSSAMLNITIKTPPGFNVRAG